MPAAEPASDATPDRDDDPKRDDNWARGVTQRSVRVIGPGRAGRSFHDALTTLGWQVELMDRHALVADAAADVDLLLITTPDAAIADVAAEVKPAQAVVAHVAGSLGLEVLATHERVAAIHPLMSLPDAELGSQRLRSNGWFAVAGDPIAAELVDALGGRTVTVANEDRATYHAAASIAAGHVVAVLGQVERLAASIGVTLEAYLDLTQGALDSARSLGPQAALTGPAARNDRATIARHLAALPADEIATYEALFREARRLATDTPTEPPSE